MTKTVVIDANIVISALIARHGETRQSIFREDLFLVSPTFILVELFKHAPRIQLSTKLPQIEVLEQLSVIVNRIRFVSEDMISVGNWIEAYRLCRETDEKDVPYIALTLEFNAALWTTDKELITGLSRKGFDRFFKP